MLPPNDPAALSAASVPSTPADPIAAAAPTAPVIPKPIPPSRNLIATVLTIALVGLTIPAGWLLPAGFNMLGVTALMFLLLVVIGWAITGDPLGALINEQNVMSLSRFQMVAWTIVILAAYFSYVLTRMRLNIADPLMVKIDEHLWALLGISTTSLVGSSLILSTKKDKAPDASAATKTAVNTAESPATVNANRQGTLYANPTKLDARFTDLFQGDELADTTHIDLAKVQMFYFTVIAVVAFVLMVGKSLHNYHVDLSYLDQLPVVPAGLIAILGISHAGYLGGKSISRTPTQKT